MYKGQCIIDPCSHALMAVPEGQHSRGKAITSDTICHVYTSDAADDLTRLAPCVCYTTEAENDHLYVVSLMPRVK